MPKILRVRWAGLCLIFLFATASYGSPAAVGITADHLATLEFPQVPVSYFSTAASQFNIFYGHTSHGSQIITGLGMLQSENSLYAPPAFYEYSDDLGTLGDTTWVPVTRAYLNSHPTCNMVIWSWCGGVTGNTEAGINIYLNAMNAMELAYPSVTFVYMTGHLDGGGTSGSLYIRNNQIRAYCAANDKVLFDFADIESYDPDGTYYPNESDACAWCATWCASHTCPTCGDCAHSHCFNCYRKAKTFWWLLARVAGWTLGPAACGDANGDTRVNVGDAVYLINYIFKLAPPPVSPYAGDPNSDGKVNVGDIVYIVNYVFKTGPVPCIE
jgi:hypothetical protein